MNTGKKAGYLLVLLVIGAVSFALFGAIYEARVGKPLKAEMQASSTADRAALMRSGASHSLREAAGRLGEGRRREAMHAMDAALRVVEVGAAAFGGVWHDVAKEVKRAKQAMANGKPMRAADAMRAATARLDEAGQGKAGRAEPGREYEGAIVINAAGARIGELTALDPGTGRGRMALGGVRDLYGFLDLGGRAMELPSKELVYGPAQWPKPTMVLAPTLAHEPAEVLSDLRAH